MTDAQEQLTEGQAEKILRAVKLADRASIRAATAISRTEVGVAVAGRLLSANPEYDTLWACTHVYASAGTDAAPLRSLLANADPAIRYMAATGLIARGDAAGFEPLIEELKDFSFMIGTMPPQAMWRLATVSLIRHTGMASLGPPFDADESRVITAYDRWRQWLAASRDRLRFNPDAGEWNVI